MLAMRANGLMFNMPEKMIIQEYIVFQTFSGELSWGNIF